MRDQLTPFNILCASVLLFALLFVDIHFKNPFSRPEPANLRYMKIFEAAKHSNGTNATATEFSYPEPNWGLSKMWSPKGEEEILSERITKFNMYQGEDPEYNLYWMTAAKAQNIKGESRVFGRE